MSNKLAGYLVCYGVNKKCGKKEEYRLETPIHNTITKSMLNNLLMLNGTNDVSNNIIDAYSLFVKYSTPNIRTGVINYGAYGSGSGATDVNDTALKNKVSEYSDTRISGAYYNGNYADSANKVFKIRCSYSFLPAVQTCKIREVGTFHRVEPDGVYSLTARIPLENPIDIDTGDSFYFVYELHISFSQEEIIEIPSINKYLRKNFYLAFGNDSWDSNQNAFPSVTTSGVAFIPDRYSLDGFYYSNCLIKFPAYSNWYNGGYAGAIANGMIVVYPDLSNTGGRGGSFSSSCFIDSTSYQQSVHATMTIQDYTTNSFKRKHTITLDPQWCPDMDIYAFYSNGECYQFGDMNNGVFTPSPWHKPNDTTLNVVFSQSWSTDLLTPNS